MKVWKIGSRWGDIGLKGRILDIFRKYNIVFVGDAPISTNEVDEGDLIAIGDGNTIVSIALVLEESEKLTKFESEFENEDKNGERFGFGDWATAFKVKIFDLDITEYFEYPSRQKFHKVGADYAKKITEIFEEKFIYLSEDQTTFEKLPFAIKQFKIRDYLGINELHISNIPTDTQWIFLTGENGFGKTTILRSIACCLNGKEDVKNEELLNSIIEIKNQDSIQINMIGESNFKVFDKFAAYGVFRTKLLPSLDISNRAYNLFEKNDSVLNFEFRFREMEAFDDLKKQRDFIINILKQLIPNLDKVEIVKDLNSGGTKVVYHEKNQSKPVEFNQLAMGMRSIIGFVCDMYFRLSNSQSNKEEIAGIVLIDEFDNHLHPKWQRMLVQKLTEIFPKVQFIVSTHSPIPLLGAPPDRTVILNVNRTKKDGITVKRLKRVEKELPNLLPNVLLTSPVFGLDEIKSAYNKDITEIIVGDNYNDRDRYAELDKSIDKFFKENDWENHELFKEV